MNHHADYIERHGFSRWVLRECVRANPFYVISAALLGYGVTQLNTEIDPQIGKAGGIILSLALLHIYELAVLITATIVLRRRSGGGRDLHGLTLVAGLFLGGSFLVLDELIAIWPWLGFVLVPAALMLGAWKLSRYAHLPGIYLPRLYRTVMLLVIGAHSISALLGSPDVGMLIGAKAVQNLAWFLGWLSLIPVLYTVDRFNRDRIEPRTMHKDPSESDPLLMHRCGGLGISLAIATGMAHLHGSDWVFDRPDNPALLLPALTMLAACMLLLRWRAAPSFGFINFLLASLPAILVQWIWTEHSPYDGAWDLATLTGPATQLLLASLVFYLMLAWTTQRKVFYSGLGAALAAPVWTYAWRVRNGIPHYRALANILAGFFLLAMGMIVSLFRDKLLARFETTPDKFIPPETNRWTPPAAPVSMD